jgi:choline dehydrogenase-like flavoprotein
MIRQGVDWTGDADESCDVVVIGSGCGGATVAKALAEAGRDVIIVEQGGYYTKEDFDQRELDMLAKIDGGRGLETSDDGAVALTYGNNVGGASVHYWADSYRLPADRLAEWEERYGMRDHPLDVLTPHFERLERDLNVHPAEDAYANRLNVLLRDAARSLGWQVERVPQARKGCVQSGFCMQGCSYDAKQSQLVTHLPAALEHGGRLFCDLAAARLLWRGPEVVGVTGLVLDRATGRPTGTAVNLQAKAVVVAAGGYGTPRFLLRQGLKETLPHVGEHIFCNPCPMTHARFDEDIVMWRNIPAAWAVEEFRRARFDAAGAYTEGGYLLMPNQLHPGTLAAALPQLGAEHRRWMRELPRLGGAIAWIDDDERARMTLEPGGLTRLSVRLIGGNALRIRDAWRKQAALLLEAGAREVLFGDVACTAVTARAQIDAAVAGIELEPSRSVLAAPHPGGGARMGADSGDSVVGFDHRVHGTTNLYVADPSVFPSAPSVDPSLTIMAFAYVAAEKIDAALG